MSAHVRMALMLNSEIANVITAMRQNEKWAVVTGKYNEDDRMEADPLYEEFRNLRRKVFQWDDWTVINPQEYLAPFLNVIRSQEVSGPITGVALTSLWRLLSANFIGVNTVGVREAVKQVVDDTTQCKFEATLPASDEVVLFNILQVLLAVVKCDAGVLLADDSVCKAYQAAFMLGNLDTEPKNKPSRECSELLTHYSRQIIGEMTTIIFQRVAEQTFAKSGLEVDLAGVPYSAYGHGEQSATDVLTFLIDLIRGGEHGDADELCVFGFQMVQRALLAGGTALQQLPPIMALVQRDLFASMVPSVRSASLAIISSICQVVLAVFQVLGDSTMLQLEAVIKRVLIKLADGESGKGAGVSIEQQEAALEGILDLCRQPGFIHDVFINCDCRIERYNLFEDICTLVSRMAYPSPHGSRLGPLHLIALEALIAILAALARSGNSSGLLAQLSTTLDLPQHINIWTPLAHGQAPPVDCILDRAFPMSLDNLHATGVHNVPDYSIRAAAAEKLLKVRVAVAADHFNRDYKKGFQFLQTNRLLPVPVGGPAAPDPAHEEALAVQVAHFIRICPGLAKQAIGELLGEPDKFYLKVLDAFTATFNFRDVPFDIALRMYLESFRLPGEAQKIDRILSSFGSYYYTQCPDLFNNQDAAYILAYATIMLNTDRHNAQVKNKINQEGFKRNLRSQNGGQDFPAEFLDDIYNSILRNEIRLNDSGSMLISPATWTALYQMSATPRGRMMPLENGASVFNAHMFQLMWVPAVHAVSVVLEYAESQSTIELVLDGLQLAARIAAQYDVDPVLDQIAVALCRMTQVLNASTPNAILKFGGDGRACLATQTLFKIVNRYGDCLRQGWYNVMDVVVRLHKLGVLPVSVRKLLDSDDSNGDMGGDILLSASRLAVPVKQSYGATAFFRSVGNLLVLQDDKSGEMSNEAQKELQSQTLKCIEACHIDEMFADSKFLRAESLVKLVQAIIMAAGVPRSGAPATNTDWEVTEVCVDLLMTVLLRNRDRISLLWPSVYEFLQSIITGMPANAAVDVGVVERGVVGLLRLCTRLLPYKVEDVEVAEHLLRGLQLVQKLDVELAWQIAEKIAAEVLALIKGAARFIQHHWAWSSVCLLLQMTAMKPEAFATAFEALRWCVAEDCLMPINFRQCVNTVHFFTDRAAQDHPLQLPAALALLEHMGVWLEAWVEQVVSLEVPPEEEATHWTHRVKPEYWKALVEKLCQLCTHPSIDVRIKSAALLQRSVVGAEKMGVPAEHWDTVVSSFILAALKEMTQKLNSREYAQAHITVRELVKVLSKVMLLVLPLLQTLPHFGQLWCQILDALAATTNNTNDQLAESVPESLKNMLLVMHSKGVLMPGWRDSDGTDLWEVTWRKCRKVSALFSPAMLPNAPL